MSVVHIFGNGFDINLDLATDYPSFLRKYTATEAESSAISKFKEAISNNIKQWSDLEHKLGEYTAAISDETEFDLIFEDISDQLKEYLLDIENTVIKAKDFKHLNSDVFMNHLKEPDFFLADELRNRVWEILGKVTERKISLITFNYTRTVEILYPNLNLEVIHVHGDLDQDIVMGVNDINQIRNGKFRNSLDVREALVKPECNSIMQRQQHLAGIEKIKAAKLVCLFGVSLGDTDRLWWELIKNEVENRELEVILFWKTKEGELNKDYKIGRIHRAAKQRLHGNPEIQITDALDTRVHVIVDSDIFSPKDADV